MNVAGKLYLVPAPLDFGCATQAPLEQILPAATLAVVARLQHWICENAKSARAYLQRVSLQTPLATPLQALNIQQLPRAVHKKDDPARGGFDARPLLAAALAGHDLGLMSEAGMPAVADPGASVVRAAHALGLQVVPLVGPSALLLALAASGLSGQSFAFVGYLPQERAALVSRIKALESLVIQNGQTQLFIETPYRNAALLQTLLRTLRQQTRLAVASGLTLSSANVRSGPVEQWKQQPWADGQAQAEPAVFAIGL